MTGSVGEYIAIGFFAVLVYVIIAGIVIAFLFDMTTGKTRQTENRIILFGVLSPPILALFFFGVGKLAVAIGSWF